jgi:malate synthase
MFTTSEKSEILKTAHVFAKATKAAVGGDYVVGLIQGLTWAYAMANYCIAINDRKGIAIIEAKLTARITTHGIASLPSVEAVKAKTAKVTTKVTAPKITTTQDKIDFIMSQNLACPKKFTAWENEFAWSVANQADRRGASSLSAKQVAIIDRLYSEKR